MSSSSPCSPSLEASYHKDGPGYRDVRRPAHGGQRHQIRLAQSDHRGNRTEKGEVYDRAIGRLGSMTPKPKQIVE